MVAFSLHQPEISRGIAERHVHCRHPERSWHVPPGRCVQIGALLKLRRRPACPSEMDRSCRECKPEWRLTARSRQLDVPRKTAQIIGIPAGSGAEVIPIAV